MRIWDLGSGQVLRVLRGHGDVSTSAAFSPDGRRLVTASYDRTARIWDTASAQELLLLSGHGGQVVSAAFSLDGRRIVTASADNSALIWDTARAQIVRALVGHAAGVTSAAFSPDGRRILTASLDRTARLWDEATGRELLRLSGHTFTVNSAAFSPDGRRIVTASYDKTARVWDALTGRQTLLLTGHTDLVSSAVFSSDGRRIATGAYDDTARIWDAASGRQTLVLIGHTDAVNSVDFSPDDRYLVTASSDETSRIWDATSGRQIMMLRGHRALLESAAFSSDGRYIVTASADRTARLWEVATGRELMVLNGHTGYVQSAAFSPDGRRIVTGSSDASARIWDARTPDLDVQIRWALAAQFDPFSSTERFDLGLPPASGVRRWPAVRSKCDELAGAPYDPDRTSPGVMLDQIPADLARAACSDANGSDRRSRSLYELGRALMACENYAAARSALEEAVARGYRSARVDLAMLLSQPNAGMLDVPRAVQLLQLAWQDGVPFAAFELGHLYEGGAGGTDRTAYRVATARSQAWPWYLKAARAGQPNALARLGEEEDAAAYFARDIPHAGIRIWAQHSGITLRLPNTLAWRVGPTLTGGTGAIGGLP